MNHNLFNNSIPVNSFDSNVASVYQHKRIIGLVKRQTLPLDNELSQGDKTDSEERLGN